MSELDERHAWAEVDAALRTAPLAQAPATLAPAVMARVRALAGAPRPRFQLTWLDGALLFFGALMLAVVYVAWVNTPEHLVLLATIQAQLYVRLLWQQAFLQAPAPALGLGLALTALVCAAFLFRGPRFAPAK